MIALLLVVLVVANTAFVRDGHQEVFRAWMTKHKKSYETIEEYETRFQNFMDTAKRVDAQNLRSRQLNSTATFGLTHLSDLSMTEIKALLKTKIEQVHNVDQYQPTGAAIPSSWDWRKHNGITGQKNEMQCGSCWAMTVAMAIESAYMIHKGKTNQVSLSTQQIVDCDTNDGGCNGGMPTTAYEYVVSAGGLATNAAYPYDGQDGTCRNMTGQEQDPITGYKLVIPAGSTDEKTMAEFMSSQQPISTAVDASEWSTYTGGVLLASQCGQEVDHGVQIIGYNGLDENGYWIIRNMWGSSWGENGFIRLQFGKNTCGLTCLPTFPTLP